MFRENVNPFPLTKMDDDWTLRWNERVEAVLAVFGETVVPNQVHSFSWKDYILPGACALTFKARPPDTGYLHMGLGLSQQLTDGDIGYPWEFAVRALEHTGNGKEGTEKGTSMMSPFDFRTRSFEKAMQPRDADETRRHMESLYGEFIQSRSRLRLDPANIPKALWPWISYAELWGIDDDYMREQLVDSAPQIAKDDLVDAVQRINDSLNAWLAGEEANADPPSDEYCAFTTMRMAADYAT